MNLKDIPGQNNIKAYFSRLVSENRLPHALLLTGPAGTGKLQIALGLAKLLLCKDRSEEGNCGVCSSCLKTDKNIHPDVHFSYPVIGVKNKLRKDIISDNFSTQWRNFISEHPFGGMDKWSLSLDALDKTFNINVKECNHIIKNLSLQSFESDYKIQIIWQAQFLGKDGNRLLKLIEEPTDKTIIILIVDNQQALLNTILSRCQIIQVPPVDDDAIKNHLSKLQDGNHEDIQEIVNLVAGNLDLAIDLFKGEDIQFSEQLLDWLRVAYTGDPEKIMAWIDALLRQGKSQQSAFFHYGLHFFKEYTKALFVEDLDILRLTDSEKKVVLNMKRIVDIHKTELLVKLFDDCLHNMRRNANMRLLFLNQSFNIEKILKAAVPALN